MAAKIAVTTDDLSLVELLELREGAWGRVYLKPAGPRLDRAEISIVLVDEDLARTLAVLEVDELGTASPGIDLTARYAGPGVTVDLSVDGVRRVHRILEIPPSPPRRRRIIADRVLAVLAALLSVSIIATASWKTGDSAESRDNIDIEVVENSDDVEKPQSPAGSPTQAQGQPGPSLEAAVTAEESTSSDPGQGPPTAAVLKSRLVYFMPDDYRLTSEARRLLDETVAIVAKSSNLPLAITGHCALFGSERGRRALSVQRAEAVYEYLLSKGWRPDPPPTVSGKGGEEPITLDRNLQYLNRRVEVTIQPSSSN